MLNRSNLVSKAIFPITDIDITPGARSSIFVQFGNAAIIEKGQNIILFINGVYISFKV